jgi:hypothetical protein
MKTAAAAIALSTALFGSYACNEPGPNTGDPLKNSKQYDILEGKRENRGIGVYDFKLLVAYPKAEGGPRWIPVTSDEYGRCMKLGATFPACKAAS